MSSSTSAAVDLTTQIGGRTVRPAFPVVDSGKPTPLETTFQASLKAWTDDNVPLEPVEGIQRRERVLNRMGVLVRSWIRSVCVKRKLQPDLVENAGGQLFTSGSYRLGVHEPGADIDCILVAPNVCTKQDFFGTLPQLNEDEEDGNTQPPRDPQSLAERIRTHPDVTNFVPVEGAAVPILTFDWEGVNIDLLFARLNSTTVPPDFDIDNDVVLDGVDSATEKSLNGPRVTNLIAALVGGTPERYDTFLAVVRCVRKWAKARGLYSNKMGYWGGVNINIGVALCVQLYPTANPASLLRKFFLVFKTWRWPNPVLLTKPHDAGYGLPVWQPGSIHTVRQVAPMITPAYPAMNSTLAVSRQTLQILHEEFCRAHAIVDGLWKEHQQDPTKTLDWNELFRPSDFFIAYPHYLSLCIVGPTQADAQAWAGFVESRLRKLVSDMMGRSLPVSKIQLWPKKIEACIADRSALLTTAQRMNSITYFIGFKIDKLRMRGDQFNVELQMSNFRKYELSRFQPFVNGMDVLTKSFKCKFLPRIVFEMYDGGKEGAMKRRRELRNADPQRQERRRKRRLEELKAKMAAIQRKKEQDAAKRQKREEAEADEEGDGTSDVVDAGAVKVENADADTGETVEEAAVKVKLEEQSAATAADAAQQTEDGRRTDEDVATGIGEETNQLETALDIIQDDTGATKTREEAEADRQLLLQGDVLANEEEDDYVPSDDEEMGYTGDAMRNVVRNRPDGSVEGSGDGNRTFRDTRALPLSEKEMRALREVGFHVVTDAEEETKVLGGSASASMPFRPVLAEPIRPEEPYEIRFRTKFDIVELDEYGHVIDKGDADFRPSKKWVGRMAGFEFKLGERGLGYYRTGKKVVVPSNTAY